MPTVAPAPPPRFFLVFVDGVPVAEVRVSGASTGNVVNVYKTGNKAVVTLRHRGGARLLPLPIPKAHAHVPLIFEDVFISGNPRASALAQALAEDRYEDVQRGLDALSLMSRDDASLELMQSLDDLELSRLAEDARGRALLARLLDELSSGGVRELELWEAQRVLATLAQRLPADVFARAALDAKTKTVSYKPGGFTVWSDAVFTARPAPDGTVDVSVTARSFRNEFQAEARTLPGLAFRVRAEEVVGVKLYREGGRVQYAPALYLVQVSNAEDTHTAMKLVEAAGFGLSLGAGALVEGGVEAGALAKVLLWCDRGALALAVLGTVLEEQRGFILSEFGADGREFLRYADVVNSVVAYYSLARLAVGAPKLLLGFRSSYLKFKARAAARAPALAPGQNQVLRAVNDNTEELFRKLEDIQAAARGPVPVVPSGPVQRPSAQRPPGAQVISITRNVRTGPPREAGQGSVPVAPEQPLALTGTDGRLVEIPRQRPPRLQLVASANGGEGPRAPQQPGSVPSWEAGAPSPGPRGRSPATPATRGGPPRLSVIPGELGAAQATESELLAARWAEAEAEAAAPRQTAVLAELETLRPSAERPPTGVPVGDKRWEEYVQYWSKRFDELRKAQGRAATQGLKPPLTAEAYAAVRLTWQRGINFENKVTAWLKHQASLPPAERTIFQEMENPDVQQTVSLTNNKSARPKRIDQMVVDKASLGPGKQPHVASVSDKSHNFREWMAEQVEVQVKADVAELKSKYNGRREVRSPGHPLYGQTVDVTELHLIYDKSLVDEKKVALIKKLLKDTGIKVHFQ